MALRSVQLVLAGLMATGVACSSSDRDTTTADSSPVASTSAAGAAVEILSPANGDSVTLPLTVRLGATGVEVIPASGQREEGKGHHHLVLDGDSPSDSLPLPQPPVVYHLGNGATERVFDSLPPGPHRLIAIFAWGDHVPMTGVRRDTLTFIVR